MGCVVDKAGLAVVITAMITDTDKAPRCSTHDKASLIVWACFDKKNVARSPLARTAPINAAHDDGKVFVAKLIMEKLGKYYLRTLQVLGLPRCQCAEAPQAAQEA